MTKYLPPHLRHVFATRNPIEYLAPQEKRKMPAYSGITPFLKHFEESIKQNDSPKEPPFEVMTIKEARNLKRKRRMEENEAEMNKKFKSCT